MRASVFEPFSRLASDAEGSGRGLGIVRAIAERWGASVAIAFPARTADGSTLAGHCLP